MTNFNICSEPVLKKQTTVEVKNVHTEETAFAHFS